jgi:peptidoglycan pentaglycine glycine transferase (the first glycine)
MADTMLSPHLHSFLQSDVWGSFRESQGWHAHKVDSILVLERSLPFGKSFLYSPEVSGGPDQLVALLPKIRSIAKERNAIFFRLELLIDRDDPVAEKWQAAFRYTHFVKAFESVQPDDRQIIHLGGTEDEILAQMKSKGRYNIRVAERSGVLVREATMNTLETDVATFYEIFQQTAKRDKFSIRSQSYFLDLCRLLYQHDSGRLFIATYQNQPLAAAIVTLHDSLAAYLYGASSNENRQVMAPYLMHWSIMQWAMSKEAKYYDLLAIRPPGPPAGGKKHPYDGITRFKEQFGGEAVHLLGSWDLPLQPTWYSLFKLAEGIRR